MRPIALGILSTIVLCGCSGWGPQPLVQQIGLHLTREEITAEIQANNARITDLAREEGLFVGWSSGSAVFGALEYGKEYLKPDDVMVIILPDHGTRYLNKVYNDDWMRDRGFLEEREFSTAKDIIAHRNGDIRLVTVHVDEMIIDTIKLLHNKGISQIPVTVSKT